MQPESGSSLPKKRPTQQDVARLAGVSQATVSYVLNNRATVSVPAETRERVLAAMQELGYVPNVTARSLRTSKSYTIASIIPDITNPFYPALQRGIQDVVQREGYDLILYNTDGARAREEDCLRSIQQAGVDGVIVVLFNLDARDLFPLLERNIAVVRVEATAKAAGQLPLDNIYVDNVGASRTAVSFLLDRGYRRIAMLTARHGPGEARLRGYRLALESAGLAVDEALTRYVTFTEDGGYRGMRDLLSSPQLPEAIFAANDLMAMGAMVAIHEHGLNVPNDIAVVGFDNISTAKLVTPPLTTINQFQRRMGERAAEMLFERMNAPNSYSGRSVEQPFELVVRSST